KEMSIWDLGAQCLWWEAKVDDYIQGLIISADGKLLTCYMANQKLQMWNCVTQELVTMSQLKIGRIYLGFSLSQSPSGNYTVIRDGKEIHLLSVQGESVMTLIGTFKMKQEYTIQFSSNERYMFIGPQVVDLILLESARSTIPLTEVPSQSVQHGVSSPISPLVCEYQIFGGKGTIYNSAS
ncbi:15299_t:CDS:1, partial [Acaulospora colombiana]